MNDNQICASLGILVGEGNGVTAGYLAKSSTRLQAAIMFLRLKGLEAVARTYKGTTNFADSGQVGWADHILIHSIRRFYLVNFHIPIAALELTIRQKLATSTIHRARQTG